MMITKKQRAVLDFISSYQGKSGYSPSLDEIRKKFNLASVSTAHFHVSRLRDLGYLSKDKHAARSLSPIGADSLVMIPLLGTIAAGKPIDVISTDDTIAVPKSKIPANSSIYALRVTGKSMIEDNIQDGDVVLVKQQNTAENGQNVVALINNQEVTLKKYYKERGTVRLQPANKKMQPLIIKDGGSLSIQGIVLDIIRGEAKKEITLPKQKKTPGYSKIPINKIICGDAVEVLRKIPSNSLDMVVTSPPYDDIRSYNGFNLDLPGVGRELHRVLKDGGIVAMVIQDATRNFGKTLTSFKTIIDWCDNAGFKLFETVIYRKYGTEGAWWSKRFRVDHEYMPIFLKGDRPSYFNKDPLKVPSKHGGKVMTGSGNRKTDGTTTKTVTREINGMKCRGTVWDYLNAGDKNPLKRKHPATFPDRIPVDFIQCFCPPGGVVLDPFIGSGSTAVAAKKLGRKYIGIDVSEEYCKIAEERINEVTQSLFD